MSRATKRADDAELLRHSGLEEWTPPPAPRAAEIERAMQGTNTNDSLPPPRPLFREIAPSEPFPIDALGDVLGPAVAAIHDIIQAPVALCAQSVLATATLAAQGCANVRLPHGSERPLSDYFIGVAETGERKTAADDLASDPIRRREAELGIAHAAALVEHEAQNAVYEAEWKKIASDRKLSSSAKRQGLAGLGPKPTPPPSPMIVCPEPTYEGLFRLLRCGPPSVGIFSNEGGQLIGGHAMNEENRLKTAAGLSDGWDGKDWKRVRGGDGLIALRNRRVTLNLMVQPLVAHQLLGDPLLRDQGLLSRLLVAAPPPASGTRFWKEPQPESWRKLDAYSQRVLAILRRSSGGDDKGFPVVVLAPTARQLSTAFADSIEKQIAPEGPLSCIRGLANKAAEHSARLAGVLEIVADPEGDEITAKVLTAAIDLVQFYLSEAVRLQEGARIDGRLRRAAQLLHWLQTSWTEKLVSLVDIYQRGPREIRDRKNALASAEVLEEHAWLVRLEGVHVVAEVRREDVWLIRKS